MTNFHVKVKDVNGRDKPGHDGQTRMATRPLRSGADARFVQITHDNIPPVNL